MAPVTPPTITYETPAEGTASYTPPEAPSFTPRELSSGETVEGRMTDMMKSKSPLLNEAQQASREQANASGLLNTTIASGAGTRAMMQEARHIATPDAATAARSGQTSQEANILTQTEGFRGEIQSGISAQKSEEEMRATSQRGDITSKLSAQQAEEQKVLAEQRGEIAANLSTQQAGEKKVFATLEAQLKDEMEDQETFVSISSGIQQEYQNRYTEIQATADSIMSPESKIRAIDALNKSTESQLAMLTSIYGVKATWSGGVTSTTVLKEEAAAVEEAAKVAAAAAPGPAGTATGSAGGQTNNPGKVYDSRYGWIFPNAIPGEWNFNQNRINPPGTDDYGNYIGTGGNIGSGADATSGADGTGGGADV